VLALILAALAWRSGLIRGLRALPEPDPADLPWGAEASLGAAPTAQVP